MLRSDSNKDLQPSLDPKDVAEQMPLYPVISSKNVTPNVHQQIESAVVVEDKVSEIKSNKRSIIKKLETNFEPSTFHDSILDLLEHMIKIYSTKEKSDENIINELNKELSNLIPAFVKQHNPSNSDIHRIISSLIAQSQLQENNKIFLIFFRKFISNLPAKILSGYPVYLFDSYKHGSLDIFRTMISAYNIFWDIDTRKKWIFNLMEDHSIYRNLDRMHDLNNINSLELFALLESDPIGYTLNKLILQFTSTIKASIKNKLIDYRSRNILHIVVEKNFPNLTKILFNLLKEEVELKNITEAERIAFVNQQDFDGNTVLHVAAQVSISSGFLSRRKNQAEEMRRSTIETLKDNGVNPDIANFLNKTAHGTYQGHNEHIKNLLKPTPIISEEPTQQGDIIEKKPKSALPFKTQLIEMQKLLMGSYANFVASKISLKEYEQEYFDLIVFLLPATNSDNSEEAKQALLYLKQLIYQSPADCFQLPRDMSGKTLAAETILMKAVFMGSAEAFRLVLFRYPQQQKDMILNNNLDDCIIKQIALEEKINHTSYTTEVRAQLIIQRKKAIPELLTKEIYLSNFELDLINPNLPMTPDELSKTITERLKYKIAPLINLMGNTALHAAVQYNLGKLVKTLLEYKYSSEIDNRLKFDPNQKNDAGQTPLQIAATLENTDPEIVNILIKNGDTNRLTAIKSGGFINYKVLDEVNKYNSLKDYMRYLEKHPSKSFNENDTAFFSHKDLTYATVDKEHPFIIALKMENTIAIEWMIKQGMDLNFPKEKYNNCLLFAIDYFEHHKHSTNKNLSRQRIIDLIAQTQSKLLSQVNEEGISALQYSHLVKPSLFSSKGYDYLSLYRNIEKKPVLSQGPTAKKETLISDDVEEKSNNFSKDDKSLRSEEVDKHASFTQYVKHLQKHSVNLIAAMKAGNVETVDHLLKGKKINLTKKFEDDNNYLHLILKYYYQNKITDKNEEDNRQKIIHALIHANPELLKQINFNGQTPFDLFNDNKTIFNNPGADLLKPYESILSYLSFKLEEKYMMNVESHKILSNVKDITIYHQSKLQILEILIDLNWFITFNHLISTESHNISKNKRIALFNKLLDESPIKYKFIKTLCKSNTLESETFSDTYQSLMEKIIKKNDPTLLTIIEPYLTLDVICKYGLGVDILKRHPLLQEKIHEFYDNFQVVHFSYMDVQYFKTLIDAGADVNAYTLDKSNTPLHCLVARLLNTPDCQSATLASIELLIKHGASLTLKNSYQQTPYDLLKDTSINQRIKNLLRPKQENLDSKPLTSHAEIKPSSKMQLTTLSYPSQDTNLIDSKDLSTKDLSEERIILPKLDTYTISPMSISEQIIRHSSIYFSPSSQDPLAFAVDKSKLPCNIDALLLIQAQFDQFKKVLSELKLNLSSSYPSIKSNLFEVTSTDIETMQSICDIAKLYAHRQLSELINSATAVRLVRPGYEVVDCLPTQVANIFLDELRVNHDPYIHLYDANLLLSESKEIIDKSEKLKNYKQALNCFSIAAKNILKDCTLSNAQDFSIKLKEYGLMPADKNNYTYIYELLDVLKAAGLDTARVKQDFISLDTQLALNHEAAVSQSKLSFGLR